MVAFHPLAGSASTQLLPVATSSQDGSFLLTTYTIGDGAPTGEYAVTIVWPESLTGRRMHLWRDRDRLGGRYADPAQTPLRIAVHPGKNEFTSGILPNSGWSSPRLRDSEKKK